MARAPRAVHQGNAHRVTTECRHLSVGNDRRAPQLVPLSGEDVDQCGDHISRLGPIAACARSDHPLPVGVHDNCIGIEFAVRVELLLREPESAVKQTVQIFLSPL